MDVLLTNLLGEFLKNPVLQGPAVSLVTKMIKDALLKFNRMPTDENTAKVLRTVVTFLSLTITLLTSYLQGNLNDPGIPVMITNFLTVILSSFGTFHVAKNLTGTPKNDVTKQ